MCFHLKILPGLVHECVSGINIIFIFLRKMVPARDFLIQTHHFFPEATGLPHPLPQLIGCSDK